MKLVANRRRTVQQLSLTNWAVPWMAYLLRHDVKEETHYGGMGAGGI